MDTFADLKSLGEIVENLATTSLQEMINNFDENVDSDSMNETIGSIQAKCSEIVSILCDL